MIFILNITDFIVINYKKVNKKGFYFFLFSSKMSLNSSRTPESRKRLDIGQKLEIFAFADKHANDKKMTPIKIADILT